MADVEVKAMDLHTEVASTLSLCALQHSVACVDEASALTLVGSSYTHVLEQNDRRQAREDGAPQDSADLIHITGDEQSRLGLLVGTTTQSPPSATVQHLIGV